MGNGESNPIIAQKYTKLNSLRTTSAWYVANKRQTLTMVRTTTTTTFHIPCTTVFEASAQQDTNTHALLKKGDEGQPRGERKKFNSKKEK